MVQNINPNKKDVRENIIRINNLSSKYLIETNIFKYANPIKMKPIVVCMFI